jgi:hypothetical protein
MPNLKFSRADGIPSFMWYPQMMMIRLSLRCACRRVKGDIVQILRIIHLIDCLTQVQLR